MEIAAIFTSAVFFSLILTIIFSAGTDGSPVRVGAAKVSNSFLLGGRALGPISDGLLKFTPLASEPMEMAPDLGVILVLAAKRTRRPDMLNKFRRYRGGWDISDKLYWASVGFTGAARFILALIWFLSFAFALAVFHCCDWRTAIKDKASERSQQCIYLLLLLLFTCTASVFLRQLLDMALVDLQWLSLIEWEVVSTQKLLMLVLISLVRSRGISQKMILGIQL